VEIALLSWDLGREGLVGGIVVHFGRRGGCRWWGWVVACHCARLGEVRSVVLC